MTLTDVIDMQKYFGAMAYEHVLGNEKQMARTRKLGQNIAEALAAETDEERTKWRGDEEGMCPVCHLNMVNILPDHKTIECPVCGSYGTLDVDDHGEIHVHYTKEEQDRSRLRWAGKLEHSTEIKTQAAGPGQIPDLKERLKPYIGYAE